MSEDVTGLNDRELLLRIAMNQERSWEQLQALAASHAALRAFVYGNGAQGLADMVRESQRWIGVINRIIWALLVPLVLSIAGFFIAVLMHRIDVVVH